NGDGRSRERRRISIGPSFARAGNDRMDHALKEEEEWRLRGSMLKSKALLLAIAYIGFISLGLPDPVAGVAWPSVRDAFSLTQKDFGLVFIALGCGYCASGFFGGKLTHALGLGNLLSISSGLVSIAMFGNSLSPGWSLFVGCAVVWGLGSGGI